MKKYYVIRGAFANTYRLYWIDDEVDKGFVPQYGEPISRKDAFKLCAQENYRRKTDKEFSGYASNLVFPLDMEDEDIFTRHYRIIDSYIVEKIKKD